MGLFSFLFKKKKEEPKKEERHFIDDVQKENKPRKSVEKLRQKSQKSNMKKQMR